MIVDVSIIIPVYKKEKYLEKCIRSLLDQSYSNFEIICIDDCSPDNSLQIMEKLAEEDKRIRIIRNATNLGAAFSRNKGIQNAQGEYLLILDADDYFQNNLVECSINRCIENDLDVLLYDYYKYDNKKNICYEMNVFPYSIKKKFETLEILDRSLLDKYSFQIGLAAPWCKMYRKKFITQNKLEFQNLLNSNDLYFGKTTMAIANRVGYLNKPFVKYRDNSEYQISKQTNNNAINAMLGCLEVKRKLIECGLFSVNKASLYTYMLKTILIHLERANKTNFSSQYNEVRDICTNYFSDTDNSFLCAFYENQYNDFINMNADIDKIGLISDIYIYAIKDDLSKADKIVLFAKRNNLKTIVWGYGKLGKSFINAWRDNGYVIDFIVDKIVNDTNVVKPAEMKKDKYYIISPSSCFCGQIIEDASKIIEYGYVFDAQAYYEYGIAFEDCIHNVNI